MWLRRPYPCTCSHLAQSRAICGLRGIGLMAMRVTTGFRACGSLPRRVGVLWTPGYWGWGGGVYAWHAGYWGPHIGFYGGVNYGFGYGGVGFVGGEWRGGHFAYNTAVVNVNTTVVRNVYVNKTVIVNNTTRTSFNGGPGGINRAANANELRASHESHIQATSAQMSHEHTASTNRANFASENHGRPATAAMSRVNAREGNQQARIGQGVKSGATDSTRNQPPGKQRSAHQQRSAQRPRGQRRPFDASRNASK